AESEYPTASVNLEPGDTLALFSDGIPETANAQDDEYGEERFGALVAEYRDRPLDELVVALREDLAGFRGDTPVGDDVTLLVIRRRSA
ncbi:serine/threonine protein phosphatase, partial [bacterium]